MIYDLAILGAGFSGLAAAERAFTNGTKFCLVAKDFGASAHFSGAFDLIDPRWSGISGRDLFEMDLGQSLAGFIAAHPKHLYARLAGGDADFGANVVSAMRRFLDFYAIPFCGDGVKPLAVFGSSGKIKPTAFAMATHGLMGKELGGKAACVGFPSLTDYSLDEITKNLSVHFDSVTPIKLSDWPTNRTSPLASLMMQFDQEGSLDRLIAALKGRLNGAEVLFLPPILGRTHTLENHTILEKTLGVRVVELLCTLPSVAGLRFTDAAQKILNSKKIDFVRGVVSAPVVENHRIQSVAVNGKESDTTRIVAQNFVLASGKFIGGGILHAGHFSETLFNLPLSVRGEPIATTTHVTQLISPQGAARQPFLDIGVTTDMSGRPVFRQQALFTNLKACGHVLTGFDFTHDRCGFGVSIASAMVAGLV